MNLKNMREVENMKWKGFVFHLSSLSQNYNLLYEQIYVVYKILEICFLSFFLFLKLVVILLHALNSYIS